MAVKTRRDDARLPAHQFLQFGGRVRISGIEERSGFESLRLPIQTLQDQPMVVAVGLRLYQHRPIDALFLHSRQVVR